jgi:hypothetical protein
MALIHDNDHEFAWYDPYGDAWDNSAVVSPGDTIRLSIFVNDLNGESWARACDGMWAGIWWDPAVVDAASVSWDAAAIDTDGDGTTDIDNYYKAYFGFMHAGSGGGANYYNVKADGSGTYRWVAENRLTISWNLTIREDAPLGTSLIGTQNAFYWNLPYDPWVDPFFSDRIESDGSDPFAMELIVAAASVPGDFDADGDVDADDIDLLMANLGGDPAVYDLTDDGVVDQADVDEWVFNIVPIGENVGTVYGDFNLDGEVNAGDLALLATNYGLAGTWGWATGDGNGDGNVDAGDLAMLATNYGTVVHPVPEPITMSLLAVGGAVLLRRRK